MLTLTSGYVQRAIDRLPRQSSRKPWKIYQNYLRDLLSVRFSRVDDRTMEFRRPGETGVGQHERASANNAT